MEGYERKEGMEDREEIYSKAVRAGKRTYFFDVKATRNNDYYLTITESKKKLDTEGNQNFEKHKIFLYKEDFEKFAEGLDEIVEYIKAALSDKVPVAERKEKTNLTLISIRSERNRNDLLIFNGGTEILKTEYNQGL